MAQGSRPEKVVVGHDNPWCAQRIADELAARGYHTASANDGREVLRVAQAWRAEHAVIDLSISGTPALQLGRELRSSLGRSVQLVGLTTWTNPHYRVEALDAGYDDVVMGPLDPGEILLTLGGPGADLVRRHRSALFDQAREMIALGHRLLEGRTFLRDPVERRRRVMLAKRALEWSSNTLDVMPIMQETRPETEQDLRALARRVAEIEAENA